MTDPADPIAPPDLDPRAVRRLRQLAMLVSLVVGALVGLAAHGVAGSVVPLGPAVVGCSTAAVLVGSTLLHGLLRTRGRFGWLFGVVAAFATSFPSAVVTSILTNVLRASPEPWAKVAEDSMFLALAGSLFLSPLVLVVGVVLGAFFGRLVARAYAQAAPRRAEVDAAVFG